MVPNLQGEFLRGTGTNPNAEGGAGANVGVHQAPTRIPYIWLGDGNSFAGLASNRPASVDFVKTQSATKYVYAGTVGTGTSTNKYYVARPTNTAVLFCIKY